MELPAALLSLVLLDIVSLVTGTSCPSGCKCGVEVVSCTGQVDFLSWGGGWLGARPDIHNVTFTECSTPAIASGAFSGLTGMRSVRFINCTIGTVHAGAFRGMRGEAWTGPGREEGEAALVFSRVSIGRVARGAFQGMQAVRLLLLAFTQVEVMEPEILANSDVETAQLSFTNITKLWPRVFSNTTQLVNIYLSYVNLSRSGLPCYTFDGFQNGLIHVEFSDVGSICAHAFSGVSGSSINMATSTIGTIHSGAFSGAVNMSMIALTYSGVAAIQEGVFDGMTAPPPAAGLLLFSTAVFVNNHFGVLRHEAFRGFRHFATIRVAENSADCREEGYLEKVEAGESIVFRNKLGRVAADGCGAPIEDPVCGACDTALPQPQTGAGGTLHATLTCLLSAVLAGHIMTS